MTELISHFLRSELGAEPNAYHGAIDFAEINAHGFNPHEVTDFSVNSNPYGPTQSVLNSLKSVEVSRYPDKQCIALRDKLAQRFRLKSDNVFVGNGTAEILWLASFAFLKPRDRVLIIEPTFGEYRRCARLMDAEVFTLNADADHQFSIDEAAVEAKLHALKPQILFVCNPNNPTGQVVPPLTLRRWIDTFTDTLFIVDEAYAQFLNEFDSMVRDCRDNLIVLRSMTKDYALAGLRLGYCSAAPSLIHALEQVRYPWSVNQLAQTAGIAALDSQALYEATWQKLRTETIWFKQALSHLGYTPFHSDMHYFLIEVDNAKSWRTQLLQRGLIVRDCESFDLPKLVRISTQDRAQNQQLLCAIKDLNDTLI